MRVPGAQSARKPRGMALIVVMVILMVVAIVVASFGTLALENLKATSAKSWERQARFAAYAGVQSSLALLDQDPEFSTEEYTAQLGQNGELRYSIEVHNNVFSQDGSATLAPDNTWIPPGAAWVRSHGYLGDVGSYQNSALIALVSRARPKFDHAIFAEDSIEIIGASTVNSYDSTRGYDNTASAPGSEARREAHLGTNSTSAGAISVGSGSWVDGNAYIGLDGQPNTNFTNGGGTLTGDLLKLDEEVDLFTFHTPLENQHSIGSSSGGPLTIPYFDPDTGSDGSYIFPWEVEPLDGHLPQRMSFNSLTVQANNPTWDLATNLFSGEYYIAGNLAGKHNDNLAGGETLVVNVHANDEFPVVLYVAGDIDLNNVKFNTNEPPATESNPRRLQIYSVTPGATFTLSGGSELHALVAGKGLKVQVTEGSRLFGGIIAGKVTVRDSQIHYDTSVLGLAMHGRTAWDILSLKEATAGEASQQPGDVAPQTDRPDSLLELAQSPQTGPRGGGDFFAEPNLEGSEHIIPRDDMEIEPNPLDPLWCPCGLDFGHAGDCQEAACPDCGQVDPHSVDCPSWTGPLGCEECLAVQGHQTNCSQFGDPEELCECGGPLGHTGLCLVEEGDDDPPGQCTACGEIGGHTPECGGDTGGGGGGGGGGGEEQAVMELE